MVQYACSLLQRLHFKLLRCWEVIQPLALCTALRECVYQQHTSSLSLLRSTLSETSLACGNETGLVFSDASALTSADPGAGDAAPATTGMTLSPLLSSSSTCACILREFHLALQSRE